MVFAHIAVGKNIIYRALARKDYQISGSGYWNDNATVADALKKYSKNLSDGEFLAFPYSARTARELIILSEKGVHVTADTPQLLNEIFYEGRYGYLDRFSDWIMRRPNMVKMKAPAKMKESQRQKFIETGKKPVNYKKRIRYGSIALGSMIGISSLQAVIQTYANFLLNNDLLFLSYIADGACVISTASIAAKFIDDIISLKAEKRQKEIPQPLVSVAPQTAPQEILYAGEPQHISGNTFEIPLVVAKKEEK